MYSNFMIDLHTHTVFSDGTWTPKQNVNHADHINLSAIAICDHDTVDGIPDFMSIKSKVLKVPGVEISIDYNIGTFHLVGLFVDHTNKELSEAMEILKGFRRDRNIQLIKSISNLLGKEVTPKDIADNNKGELGRPHMAKFLIKEGVVKTMNEAFDTYLGKGQQLYLPKKRFDIDKAIRLIKNANGLSILAHPSTLNIGIYELNSFIKKLKEKGMDGMETHYHSLTKEDCKYYANIAKKYDLLTSVGSDFHGANKKNISIGQYKNPPKNPDTILNKMLEQLGRE